jgi:hypothetical protein
LDGRHPDGSATPEQIIEFAIGNLTNAERRDVLSHISELTSGRYSEEELSQIGTVPTHASDTSKAIGTF